MCSWWITEVDKQCFWSGALPDPVCSFRFGDFFCRIPGFLGCKSTSYGHGDDAFVEKKRGGMGVPAGTIGDRG